MSPDCRRQNEGMWYCFLLLACSPGPPPEGRPDTAPAHVLRSTFPDTVTPTGGPPTRALILPEDLEPLEPGSALRIPRTLSCGPRAAPDHFVTSSSLVRATIADRCTTGGSGRGR